MTAHEQDLFIEDLQTGNDVHQALRDTLEQMQDKDLPIEYAFRIIHHHETEAAEYCLQRLRNPDLGNSEQGLIMQVILMHGVADRFIELLLSPASEISDLLTSRLSGAGLALQIKIAAFLKPAEWKTALRGLELLKALGASPVIVPRLFAMLYQTTIPQIQDMAVELINELDTRLVYTRRLLNHPDPRIRASALRLISSADDKHSHEYLTLFAADPDNRVRSMAALELHRRHDPQGTKILREMISKDDPEMRRSAIWALGIEGGERAIPILKKLQTCDPDERVRRQAGLALQKIDAAIRDNAD
jgi:hypothetical protein